MKNFTLMLACFFFAVSILTGQEPGETTSQNKQNPKAMRNPIEYLNNTGFKRAENTPDRQTLRRVNEMKQGLDSLYRYEWDVNSHIWRIGFRNLITYDANGNFILSVNDNWDGCCLWIHDIKFERTYDENERPSLTVTYEWDINNNLWIPADKEEITYNDEGYIANDVFSQWDDNNSQWVYKLKNEYKYDASGNITTHTRYKWNTNQWESYVKEDFTYNGSGNLSLLLTYDWNSNLNQWVFAIKKEYLYDVNDNLRLTTQYGWDLNSSQWIPVNKTENVYDNINKLLSTTYSNWNTNNDQWDASFKIEYAYNNEGMNVLETYFYWDNITSQWIPSTKRETLYDINGIRYLKNNYVWDTQTSSWIANYKTNYTYNGSYTYNDLLLPYYYQDAYGQALFNYMLNEIADSDWDENNSVWVNNSKIELFYSEHETNDIPNLITGEIKVYPNPATNIVRFEINKQSLAKLELFDMMGNSVLETSFKGTLNLAVNQLACGLYLYRISYGNQLIKGKLTIE